MAASAVAVKRALGWSLCALLSACGGKALEQPAPADAGAARDAAGDAAGPACTVVPGGWRHIRPPPGAVARWGGCAAWSGKEALIFGGDRKPYPEYRNDGIRVDPVTGAVRPMSLDGTPEWRTDCLAAWTGSGLLVWGGQGVGPQHPAANGARYNPALDRWTAMASGGQPDPLDYPAGVWTGNALVVLSGFLELDTTGQGQRSGRYDPAKDAWSPIAPDPALDFDWGAYGSVVAWTGSEIIAWVDLRSASGRYDPATDSWHPMSTTGAPDCAGCQESGVRDGQELLVWSDTSGAASYDPATDSWSALPAPAGSYSALAWTGRHVLLLGGKPARYWLFDPGDRTYTAVPRGCDPVSTDPELALGTGNGVLIWGDYQKEQGWYLPDP